MKLISQAICFACCLFHARFLLGLLFIREDGSDISSKTSTDVQRRTRRYIAEERILQKFFSSA
jgi:hypothetical protein